MKSQALVTGLLSIIVAASPISTNKATDFSVLEARQGGCSKVHVIVARASTEPAGMGMIGSLARSVSGATTEAVSYPAALAPYGPSEIKGVVNAKAQITAYVKKCPQAKIVLMGYSQGADVVGSVPCGGGGFTGSMLGAKVVLGPRTPPIAPEIGSHIAAVVMMGDPRATPGRPWNQGTAKREGQFPHPAMNTCKGYESRMISFCDNDDEFCDSGSSLGPHMGYMTKYSGKAKAFIAERLKDPTFPYPPAPLDTATAPAPPPSPAKPKNGKGKSSGKASSGKASSRAVAEAFEVAALYADAEAA